MTISHWLWPWSRADNKQLHAGSSGEGMSADARRTPAPIAHSHHSTAVPILVTVRRCAFEYKVICARAWKLIVASDGQALNPKHVAGDEA